MSSLDLPRPHVFIAALGRSGSTMLANLMSTPPHRWVMVEPRFANGSTGNDLLAQSRSMGLDIADDEWTVEPSETFAERVNRLFRHRLQSFERWGLKEVRADLLEPTIEQLDPQHVVVLVRDLRDSAVSLFQKSVADDDPRYGDEWLRDYLTRSPRAIMSLCDRVVDRPHTIVKYEQLVADPSTRAEVALRLDWPLDGVPDRNLADLYGRSREVALHGTAITTRSLGRHQQLGDARASQLVDWVEQTNADFLERFGYT